MMCIQSLINPSAGTIFSKHSRPPLHCIVCSSPYNYLIHIAASQTTKHCKTASFFVLARIAVYYNVYRRLDATCIVFFLTSLVFCHPITFQCTHPSSITTHLDLYNCFNVHEINAAQWMWLLLHSIYIPISVPDILHSLSSYNYNHVHTYIPC